MILAYPNASPKQGQTSGQKAGDGLPSPTFQANLLTSDPRYFCHGGVSDSSFSNSAINAASYAPAYVPLRNFSDASS